jgi:transposase
MMRRQQHVVELTPEDRARLVALTQKGKISARMLRRAHILLLADEGVKDEAIAATVRASVSTVERTRKVFAQSGVEKALVEKPRKGAPPRLDGRAEAYLVALACSDPPEGRQTWTMQLLADRMVELSIVPRISDETVRRTLKKTISSPGRRNSGVLPR